MVKQLLWKFLIIIFLAMLVNPSTVQAAKDKESIQMLLNEASAGDIVQLENRIYNENVVINEAVVLKGAEHSVIKGTGEGNVITLSHDGITLENITIQESGTVLDRDYAGIKVLSDDNLIKGNTIKDNLHGIYLSESEGNKLIQNTIVGNQTLSQSSRGNGIHLFHSSNNTIIKNTIKDVRDGIYFSFSEHNQIKENQVFNNRYGLHYMYSDYNDFYKNEFFENVGGAAIMYSNHISLRENLLYDHHGLQSFGILLQTSSDVELTNNHIQFNHKGIFMDQSNQNILRDNQITNNRIGLDIWSSSIKNKFSGNQILHNNLQYTTNQGKDKNAWSMDGEGNAWSDHNIVDLNQNGIAENPYVYISSYGKVLSDQPLGNLFLDSPSLGIYEEWNQLFSTGNGKVEDPNPINIDSKTVSLFPYGVLIMLLTLFSCWFIYRRLKMV